jgi:hypothetical protein
MLSTGIGQKDKMMFSVIVPCHNTFGRESNFQETLSKIDTNIVQLIVVFDNLDEKSQSRIEQILDNFPELQLDLVKGKFGSPGAARNAGLKIAKQDWVVFWDFDDLPNFQAVKSGIELAILHNYDCVVGGYKTIRVDQKGAEHIHHLNSNYLDQISLNPGIWRFAFSRNILSNHLFPEISMAEDQVLLGKIIMKSPLILVSDQIFYSYFIGDDNQVTRQKHLFSDLLISSEILLKELENAQNLNKTFVSRLVLRQLITATLRGNGKVKLLSALKFLRNISLLRSAVKRQKDSRNILHLTGGLGNQLFQFAAAFSLTGGKGFSIETQLGKPRLNFAGEPEIFSFSLINTWKLTQNFCFNNFYSKISGFKLRTGIIPTRLEELPLVSQSMSAIINMLMSIAYKKRLKVIASKGVGYCDVRFESDQSTYLIGYFQSWRWAYEPRVLNQLKLLSPIDRSVDLEYWHHLSKSEKPLVVHFRLGDYKLEDSFGIPELEYYENAIQQAWKSGNFNKIWIFSDEIDSAKERFNLKELEMARWIDTSKESSANALEIMRFGAGYVIANSSFSWWAAVLSHSENPGVIAPYPWFKSLEEPLDLIPKNWTRIAAWNQ